YYPFYIYAIDFWGDEVARKQYPKEKDAIVKAAKQIVKELDVLYEEDNPKFIETVDDLGRAYSILRLHGMTSKDNVKKPVTAFRLAGRFLCLLLTFPLALSGFVNTIIGIVLYRLLRKKVKDQQFIASIRVLSAIFIVPILYILQTIVFGIISGSWAYTLLYLFVSPVIFYFACYWRKWFKAATRAGKIRRFARKYKEEWLFVNKLTDKKE
ncbi:MAG: hypothetical protein PHR20_01200, partial [Bacteroidales bacterium]|nr:hypothetical protein [Bacteroidales bacterium]